MGKGNIDQVDAIMKNEYLRTKGNFLNFYNNSSEK